ncbi:expressed unknown protein [Seminavis robusta]|uniref:Ankyrin n=1 Tax=Seminavis robusta TaxID=568900 RepID=A0A9N8HFS2_9STRA|nr:expressed unknown protein [Seminavis robusta]|eukprot:Sro589_g171660.1 n/a (744) ;mRNA; f:8721-10952
MVHEGDENGDDETNNDEKKRQDPCCSVCSIALGSWDNDEQQEQPKDQDIPRCSEYVALACANPKCRCEKPTYYCTPDCWEHFVKFQWGIYSGLGQAHQGFQRGLFGQACEHCRSDMVVITNDSNNHHNTLLPNGCLSLEQALTKIAPEILVKALTILQHANTSSKDDNDGNNSHHNDVRTDDDEDVVTIRRITQDLEEQRLLQCPSCKYKIAIPENRGCDAAWCEHCGRALCLYCLTDCGDHPKTDATAHQSARLIGDAHEHVLHNDCGWTAGKGIIHSGKTLARHHERQFVHKVALRLKRVANDSIRQAVCRNLQIQPELLLLEEEHDDCHDPHHENNNQDDDDDRKQNGDGKKKYTTPKKRQSLTDLRRQMENDKWEHYPPATRVSFLHAAYKGDVPLVKCLLQSGIPCNIPDAMGGETALHFAAVKGHVHVIQTLLHHGANPWSLSPPGRIPLDDLCNMESSCDLNTARCLTRACMVTAPVIMWVGDAKKNNPYPWLRPWPNGTTALACAKKYHPDSPVKDYFAALQHSSYRLCKACAEGDTENVRLLLSNTTNQFPSEHRVPEEEPAENNHNNHHLLPPAQDLIWIYNQGSGCTPLLDLCAKSLKNEPQHILVSAKRILKVAKEADADSSSIHAHNMTTTVQTLLQMRDFKFQATVLHWLALDPRPAILQIAGLFLQHAGNALSQAVDKRGHTALEWARRYALNKDNDGSNNEDAIPEERQRHVERWQSIVLAWEEEVC